MGVQERPRRQRRRGGLRDEVAIEKKAQRRGVRGEKGGGRSGQERRFVQRSGEVGSGNDQNGRRELLVERE